MTKTWVIQFDEKDESFLALLFKKLKVKKTILPTSIEKEPNENSEVTKPQFGFMKNQFVMSEDFDAPLDDFKEYM
jgi:hypothetical protein